ncbi:MAG: hypothetical protein RLZZ469_1091 [Bacteroidota bacterium]
MSKKLFLVGLVLLMAACNTSQSVVRTSKSNQPKASEPVAQRVKKPIYRPATAKSGGVTAQKSASNPTTNTPSSEILEATTRVKVTTEMVLAYIEKYKNIAKENMVNTGIPASITLGQAILESGAGTGPLSVQANNHFGIKCHKEWTGPSIRYTDDAENECFRKYEEPSGSFKDHSYFLTSRTRYASLFQLGKDDYAAWARGLKAAGYATDPKYPEKLIGLIERYQLGKYDAEVLGKSYVASTPKEVAYSEDVQKYTVVKGDTLYSISKRFNITVEELKRKNNMVDNALSLGQTIIVK